MAETERIIGTISQVECPKCGAPGWSVYHRIKKRYESKTDTVKWECWDCGYEGLPDEFKRDEVVTTGDSNLYRDAAKIMKRWDELIKTSGREKPREIRVTLEDFQKVMDCYFDSVGYWHGPQNRYEYRGCELIVETELHNELYVFRKD